MANRTHAPQVLAVLVLVLLVLLVLLLLPPLLLLLLLFVQRLHPRLRQHLFLRVQMLIELCSTYPHFPTHFLPGKVSRV